MMAMLPGSSSKETFTFTMTCEGKGAMCEGKGAMCKGEQVI